MPASFPLLPTLHDEELADRFGDDSDALRRYRLLHAVLVLGLPQREAAAAHGVSERTVRNVLQSFRRSGSLEALRSQQGTKRRELGRRSEGFEAALAQALAEEPQAGGDRLWCRAQVLLGEAGGNLSRRTAYRLLARLRTESQTLEQKGELNGVVRAALPLLLEDPPLSLGASALALRLLPNEEDRLLRGTLLQQALRIALDRLRPTSPISTVDRNWWPYLICSGEYEASQSRVELQRDLALSASTYSRAKRQGLTRIARMLPGMLVPMIETPMALASRRLPRTADVVGRREEQSYYTWRLQTEGLAYIWGLPGSGKTALAAELAAEGRRYGQMVLWHTCRPGPKASVAGIVAGLAEALASAGDEQLWRELRHAHEREPSVLIELLHERLLARPAVLVLDDVHHAGSEEVAALLALLIELAGQRVVRLLLVGQIGPALGEWPQLPGMSEREAQLLWTGLPALPAVEWSALYTATGGLPQPLRLAVAAYRRVRSPARADHWKSVVMAWAHDHIWERLAEREQWLLTAIQAAEPVAQDQNALMASMPELDEQVWESLRRQGLIRLESECVSIHPVLRCCATAALAADPTAWSPFLERLSGTPPTSIRQAMAAVQQHAAQVSVIDAEAPAGLELLARVRNALQNSAEYLQHNGGDGTANRLALELTLLQAALPDPRPGQLARS